MTVRVVHVITTLDRAGAQLLLCRLVSRLDASRVAGEVICLGPDGPAGDELEAAGWPVTAINMRPGAVRRADLQRLGHALRRADADVTHTWMYHADLLGGLVARARTHSRVIWSLHQSALPADQFRRSTRAIARLNAGLSWVVPDRIVSTSWSARDFHARLGYRQSKIDVIPTSFEIRRVPRSGRLRRELGVGPDVPLVVRVGRFHAQKDYPTFFCAMESVLAKDPLVHVVAIGEEVTADNAGLGLPSDLSRVHLLGERADAADLVADCDVAVSSSAFGESTPLVIGEAMAAGVPVVTTDVGDSARLVGDTGRVVLERNPVALSAAVLELLRDDQVQRESRIAATQARIVTEYGLDVMVTRYEELYESTLSPRTLRA